MSLLGTVLALNEEVEVEAEVAAQKLLLLLQLCRCSDSMASIQQQFHSTVPFLFLLTRLVAQRRPTPKWIHSL